MITCHESGDSQCLLEVKNVGFNIWHDQILNYPLGLKPILPVIATQVNGTLHHPSQKLVGNIMKFYCVYDLYFNKVD